MNRQLEPGVIARHCSELRRSAQDLAEAKKQHLGSDAAKHQLQVAVDAAREAGLDWEAIGDAIGLRRGNAYQRFRKRSTSGV